MDGKTTKKKAVSKKAPAKESVAEKTVAKVRETVSFYFPKANHSVFIFKREGISVKVKVESNMIRVAPTNPNAEFIIRKLRENKRNTVNGGNMFAEVDTGASSSSNAGDRIDQLNSMDTRALVALLGGDITLNRLSKGALIAKALDLD